MRAAALRSLADPGRDELMAALGDADLEVRCAAAAGLLRAGAGEQALAVLRPVLDGEDPDARYVALEALAAAASPGAFELGVRGLADPVPRIRGAAAHVLAGADPVRALPPLVHALDDADPDVRSALCAALAAVGPPAVAAVVPALFDPDPVGGGAAGARGAAGRRHAPGDRAVRERGGGRGAGGLRGVAADRGRRRGGAAVDRLVGRTRPPARASRVARDRAPRRAGERAGDRQPVRRRPGAGRERARGPGVPATARGRPPAPAAVGARRARRCPTRGLAPGPARGRRSLDPRLRRTRTLDDGGTTDERRAHDPDRHGAGALPAEGLALRRAPAPRPRAHLGRGGRANLHRRRDDRRPGGGRRRDAHRAVGTRPRAARRPRLGRRGRARRADRGRRRRRDGAHHARAAHGVAGRRRRGSHARRSDGGSSRACCANVPTRPSR